MHCIQDSQGFDIIFVKRLENNIFVCCSHSKRILLLLDRSDFQKRNSELGREKFRNKPNFIPLSSKTERWSKIPTVSELRKIYPEQNFPVIK
jgi:hypothetical protein